LYLFISNWNQWIVNGNLPNGISIGNTEPMEPKEPKPILIGGYGLVLVGLD